MIGSPETQFFHVQRSKKRETDEGFERSARARAPEVARVPARATRRDPLSVGQILQVEERGGEEAVWVHREDGAPEATIRQVLRETAQEDAAGDEEGPDGRQAQDRPQALLP